MLHNKSARLMSPSEYTQRIAAQALNHVARMQTTPTGTIVTNNADGTKTIAGPVLGTDSTGTSVTTATHVGDTTPPGVPTGVTAWSGDGSLHVSWDGTLDGGIPADFLQVNLLVDGRAFATLTGAGSATCNGVATGTTVSVTATSEDDACAVDGTSAHNVSAACAAVSVTVTNVAGNTDQHFWADTDGAHVSSTGDHDLTGANLLLTSTRLAFRNALAELFSIVMSGTQNTISMLGGLATIAARTWTYGTTTYTGITTKSADGVSMECDSPYDGEPTCVKVEKTSPSAEEGGCVHLEGKWLFPKDPSITTADAGYEAHMSSLYALVAGADTHIVAGVDVATLARRIATAIQPVVLYNGGAALDYDTAPGEGATGTVTLSETAANFKELTIVYRYGECASSSVTITNPDGRTVGLYLMFVGADGNLWIKTRNISVSGTSIANATRAANIAFSLTDGACLLAQSNDTPEIVVDRVTGRR